MLGYDSEAIYQDADIEQADYEWASRAFAQQEWEDERRGAPLATESDAHAEWHRVTGIPMGTPGCPQDACDAPYGPSGCDRCGADVDLFHNEASGLALCEACDMASERTATWSKLRNGAWGVKVTGPGAERQADETIGVTKRSGEVKAVQLGRLIWAGDDVALYAKRRIVKAA